jgi:hypothetical protein
VQRKWETRPNYSRNRTPQLCVQNSDKDPNIRLIPEIDVCLSDIQICAQKNLISQQVARNLVGRRQQKGKLYAMFSDYTSTSARAMAQGVTRRPLTAKARTLVIPFGICGGRVALGVVFLRGLGFFRSQFYLCSILIHH